MTPLRCPQGTTLELARHFGIDPHRIRVWASRGLITASGKRGRNKLYRLADVARCDGLHARYDTRERILDFR